jgi:hypothetical protein
MERSKCKQRDAPAIPEIIAPASSQAGKTKNRRVRMKEAYYPACRAGTPEKYQMPSPSSKPRNEPLKY